MAGALLLLGLLVATSCSTPRPALDFQQALALSEGPGVLVPNVPPISSDRANGGISAVGAIFTFWKTPVLSKAAEDHLAASMDAMLVPPEEVMVDLADRRLLWSFSFYGTLSEVERRLLAGIPVLAMVQDDPDNVATRRYVVIYGFIQDNAKLLVHEGRSRPRVYDYNEFRRIWKPVRNWCMVICPVERISWPLNQRELAARVRFLERTSQWESALADLDALQAEDPENINIMLARARILQRSLLPAEAENEYRRVLAIDPLSSRAANNLAYLLLARGQKLDEAEQWSRRALTIEPSNPAYLDTLGAILLAQKRPAEAAPVLERARYRAGNLSATSRREIDIRLIRAFVESGQLHLARQVWAELKRNDPAARLPLDLEQWVTEKP